MMRMGMLGGLLSLSIAACGANNGSGGGGGGGTDAGSMTTDTGSTTRTDSAVATDSGARDAGSTTPRDSGNTSSANYGTCGMATVAAICNCGNNQSCQQMALNSSPADCQQCLGQAQAQCCPSEFQMFQSCAQMAMCQDLACAQRSCGSQIMAFQSCLNTAIQAEAMTGGGRCTNLQQPCLGDLVTMGQSACP